MKVQFFIVCIQRKGALQYNQIFIFLTDYSSTQQKELGGKKIQLAILDADSHGKNVYYFIKCIGREKEVKKIRQRKKY